MAHSPSGYLNSEHPEAAHRLAARYLSTGQVPKGCANSTKVCPEKVLAFWGNFLDGVWSPLHAHTSVQVAVCPVHIQDHLQHDQGCSRGRA